MRKLSRYFVPTLGGLLLTLLVVVVLACPWTASDSFALGESFDEEEVVEESNEHFVTIYDQGTKLAVKTEAATVTEVLERAGVVLNGADIVEPGLDAELDSEVFYINIYRARPVVMIDGVNRKYVMTASYDPTTIAAEAGLTIYDGDEIEMVYSDNFLEVGVATTYKITRNGGRMVTIEETIPFGEETKLDYAMAKGESQVAQIGEDGRKIVKYQVNFVDGVEVSRELISEEIVKEPVTKIISKGAKASISPEQETCAGWVRAAGVSEGDVSAAVDLIYHESGCRYDAANASGAYGIPQALPGSKMSSAGADWETNPVTQIKWMSGYVTGRYGGWQQAVGYWYEHGWY